jgi:hypothetical protein
MTGPNSDSLSKEDLFLLLESYKNSVEMNTVISQQLTNILDTMKTCRDDTSIIETNLLSKINDAISITDNLKDKLEIHNIDAIKRGATSVTGMGRLSNKVNLVYVATGSVVVSVILLVIQVVQRHELIKAIAIHLGV